MHKRTNGSDPELLAARCSLAAAQAALDKAHERIRRDAAVLAELNARLAEQTEARDAAEIRLFEARASEPTA